MEKVIDFELEHIRALKHPKLFQRSLEILDRHQGRRSIQTDRQTDRERERERGGEGEGNIELESDSVAIFRRGA